MVAALRRLGVFAAVLDELETHRSSAADVSWVRFGRFCLATW